jgi:putative peptidoglycan lipid II flippase
MDAYFGSLEVPTVLTNITVNGLNVAVTPAYARLVHHQREDEASEVLSSILNVFVIVLTILTAVMIVLPRLVVRIFAPGLSTETVDIAATLIPLLVPTLVINVLIGFMTNILSVKDKFALPALSVILVPFATLVFTLVAGREIGVRAVAAGFLAGTVIQLFVMILLMRRAGVHYRFALHLRHPEVRRVVGQLWPMLVGASLVQVNSLVDQIIGSFFGVGSVSALNYAGKVINVPVGVLFLAGSRAVLPYFSRQVAAHDIQGLKNSLRIFAWLVGGLSLGISVIFIAFSGLIVKVLFQRGEFSESDAALTAAVLIGFSVGLCPMALEFMIPRVFSALHRNQILLGVTTFTLLANVILDLAFAYGFGVPGIALATSIDYIFTTALLLILLRREIGPLGLLRPPIDVLLRARRRGSTKAKPAGAESVASRL